MRTRKLGPTGLDVSILGFGLMRLPLSPSSAPEPDVSRIDEKATTELVHHAVDHGVNYFDTAYVYHGGRSEVVLGRALAGGRRDKVLVATKLPIWVLESEGDAERLLDEQLTRLATDRIDVYLLHGLRKETWATALRYRLLEFLDKAVRKGKVRFPGFSFHDDPATFREILAARPWDVCQIQYNYFDENYQAGREGLLLAAGRGAGVVVMEPLRGGRLAANLPAEVARILKERHPEWSPAEWALRWVWNHPGVSTVLSGMNSMDQLRENLRVAEAGLPDSLDEEDLALLRRAESAFRKRQKVDCTACGYCLDCPSGVNIPAVLALFNDLFVFDNPKIPKMSYNHFMPVPQRATACTECGECEEKCPQKIEIRKALKEAHAALTAR
jgi:predicted aldo/keto reductase-like oxidoreductase